MSGRTRPTRKEHPLPAVLMHAVHMLSLVVLVFTGFYLHSPFFSGGTTWMRNLHFICMWTFLFTTIIRIYWAFFGAGSAATGGQRRMRDYKWFSPFKHEGEDNLRETLKYYLFIRKSHPHFDKYNPLQRYVYLFWAFILIPLSALSGLALWAPTQRFFEPMTYWLGGLAAMRGYHYLIMWAFIILVGVHIYLTISEAAREWRVMFAWKEAEVKAPE